MTGACALCGQTTHSQCVGCKTVYYCTRECQKAHWKLHKKECASLANKKDVNSGTANTTKGEMSPALKYQLERQKVYPNLDYILVRDNVDVGMKFGDAQGSLFFNLCKKKAVEVRDPRSVFMMYQQMQTLAQKSGVSDADLRKQLKDEYGIDPIEAKDMKHDGKGFSVEDMKAIINEKVEAEENAKQN